mgnify:CR=1 FL=1
MKQITESSTVTVNYTGKLEDGTVFDTSLREGREPLTAVLGQNQLIRGFEQGLMGMSEGETKTIEIEAADAYGESTEEMITEITNLPLGQSTGEIRVSGSLEKHYSPKAMVILDGEPKPGDGFIAMADFKTPNGVIRLAEPRDNEDFARLLYTALRSADERSLSRVFVRQPVGDGIAIAIRDRLMRASRGQ